jgi:hypothetical protein
VSKKRGTTMIRTEKYELIQIYVATDWRICIDYRKLNTAIRKYYFSLSFIDQLLERLINYSFFCYLDMYSGFFQVPIHLQDQEKITFSCPYETYTYRRIPFGLYNVLITF